MKIRVSLTLDKNVYHALSLTASAQLMNRSAMANRMLANQLGLIDISTKRVEEDERSPEPETAEADPKSQPRCVGFGN